MAACNDCAAACERCATACLGETDVAMLARCIRLDRDCADICRLAAAFMARDSDHAVGLCSLCADICDTCADECERHAHMEHCARCAEACRRCARECREMAGVGRDVTPA
jgi:hypothetical protein